MAVTWTEMARTALNGGRLWRAVRGRQQDATAAFSAVDFMVLNLALDLVEASAVVCPDGALRGMLATAWAEAGRERQVAAGPVEQPHILLLPCEALAPASVPPLATLVFGLRDGLPLAGAAAETRLRLLAVTSAALWQCGLGLVVTAGGEPAADALLGGLARCMRGEWIDPLALYERVQVLTARLKGLGDVEAIDPDARADRIAELEHELASLKRSALVQQHLLLVDAAERARTA